jgi:hypothetical protein
MHLILTPQNLNQSHVDYFYLLICMWMNVVDVFNFMSIFSQSVVQKASTNMMSLSKMMLLGIQKCTQKCSKNMFFASYSLKVFV